MIMNAPRHFDSSSSSIASSSLSSSLPKDADEMMMEGHCLLWTSRILSPQDALDHQDICLGMSHFSSTLSSSKKTEKNILQKRARAVSFEEDSHLTLVIPGYPENDADNEHCCWYSPDDYKRFRDAYVKHAKTLKRQRQSNSSSGCCGGKILLQNYQAFCDLNNLDEHPQDENNDQEDPIMSSPQVATSMKKALKSLQDCLDRHASSSSSSKQRQHCHVQETAVGLERIACLPILEDKKQRRALLTKAILKLQNEQNLQSSSTARTSLRRARSSETAPPKRPVRRVSDPRANAIAALPIVGGGEQEQTKEEQERRLEAIRLASAEISRPSRLFAHHIAVAGRAA